MARSEGIPAPTVRRLSLYLRQLEAFRESNLRTVSSKQLGQALRITDAQVRKDLAHFGQFGQPGIGYAVDEMITRLRGILGTDRTWKVLLVGAGNLGRALAAYREFEKKGFELTAVFDNDPEKIDKPFIPGGTLVVHPVDELAARTKELGIRLGLLAVPPPIAQSVADRMIDAGIRGILNFTPVSLHVPGSIAIANVDMAIHLEQLSFRLAAGTTKQD